ncbi:ABC transporter ATP-binding protein [Aquiflexum lacus]|uniref:ABC transporter ATP-binding protein n=1 Tax=Aquiflexum lacus TaxID=2483805 RepID=UPI00189488A5|nr:ABC transporter ATP-binding protein [Aquiflexum lacus]
MISVQNLKKQYKEAVVLDVESLEIPKSECFGLVGNNGAGKTTLFRIMLDLVRASSGEVFIDGQNVSKTEDWKARVGAYLDEHMLLSYLTPDEYFETLRKIYRLSEEDLKLHLENFKDLFNDEILGKKKYIRDLSKGNLKKVGIAAALMGNPEVILLDEPFENLDPSSQIRLKKLILREKERSQITFLISSHDLNHVTDICDRIVLLEKGKVIKDLKEKELMMSELDSYFTG